jgi:predicted deacylase
MPNQLTVRHLTATLRSGEEVSIPTWVLDSGKPGPCLLLTAAQHGNEVQGSEVIRRFVDLASRKKLRGKVLAVPFANLPAVRARRPHIRMKPERPYGDDRGHNMNRTWPGKKTGNDTARVSYAAYQAFGDEATHVFDFHCWEKHAAPAVLIRDTPGLRDLAAKLGHRFVHVSAPNNITIGGYFCSTGRVGVTYEFSGQYIVVEDQVKRGLRLLTNFAKAIGILGGALQKGDDPVLFSDRMKTVDVTAPMSGLFVECGLSTCEPVEKGALLGRILSDVDLDCQEIRSPADGYLRAYGASRANCDVALPGHHPYVTEGERLATIAWPAERG